MVPTYKVMPGLLGGTTEFSVIVITSLPYFKSPKHRHSDVIQFVVILLFNYCSNRVTLAHLFQKFERS